MFQYLIAVLDWGGTAVFAITGALVASRKQMDISGFALLGAVTGIGGGTLRDLLLGKLPVFWISQPAYLVVCVIAAAITFFIAHVPESRLKLLMLLDAVGLSLFAVVGAQKGLAAGVGPIIAITMGVMTATFGGIIRDVLGGESPVVLRREIYISAALAGSAIYVLGDIAGLPLELATVTGFVATLTLRLAAMHWHWSLPVYRPRPARSPDDLGL
ncbi:trimeric intracellular cation channel family protein [Radicibacter daui]|uniref:trimeric intracellular cation channel family protein n=1 Tax=Radicibacter daui TaxID=3064829 RepID=UPI004046DC1A